MGREKELYSILIEKKYKTAEQANILLEAVIKNRRKLSNRRLKNEKYNLIKRIKENYSVNDFFNSRIPNYKVLASIYNVFELESSKEKIGPIEETDSKISIVENICGQSIKQSKKSKDLFSDKMTKVSSLASTLSFYKKNNFIEDKKFIDEAGVEHFILLKND